MRVAVVVIVATWLAACRSGVDDRGTCVYHGVHFAVGQHFQELCNDCTCMTDGVACTLVYCGQTIDANPSSCVTSAGCTGFGPQCGTLCCNPGERCVDGQCICGTQPGCSEADLCGGPAMQDGCGETCCGSTGACPL
jgi:hypothetical protein